MSYTADTLDVLSQQEAIDATGGNGVPTAQDGALDRAVTAISRRLDRLCGPIVQRTITSEVHSGGFPTINLRNAPVSAITSVTEYIYGTGTALTAETPGASAGTAYLAYPHPRYPALLSGRLARRVSFSSVSFWPGTNNIVVTYTAGRYATTAAVDDRFKQAAAIMLKNIWRSNTPGVGRIDQYDVPYSNFPTFGIPNAVLDLLQDEMFEIVGIA